jgi:hypothetical protein
MQGIFDVETFIENPAAPTTPVHTFDVGFWFNSPTEEQQACGNATAPAITPFNGEQNAGLLAMITKNEPLQLITSAAPGAGVNAPAHGTSRVGALQRFVTTCSDRRGWRHIRSIDFKLTDGRRHGSLTSLALWAQYDQYTNVVRLFDPRTRTWQHGVPGSARVLSNGYVSLRLSNMRVRGVNRRTVQVTWPIVFTSQALASNYRQSLRIVDDSGATRGWRAIGSWSVSGSAGARPHVAPRVALGSYGYGDTPTPGPSNGTPPPATNTPVPTSTAVPASQPSATAVPPSATSAPPSATSTPVPAATTAVPTATDTPVPPTNTPIPSGPCGAATCTFGLGVNPGLLAGKPFACPAIQHATASISIANRFPTDAPNDTMTLSADGLPPNTGFDLFLVENSPLGANPFNGFGFGWYQSDVESDGSGHASVTVKGIFDHETFIENPANGLTPTHTYNVGFWFNSPTEEQQVCGNATTPATTPFNGEQNAGLLAMITEGGPLQFVH